MGIQLPQINKINADIKNLSIYFRSVHKWGKSTTFRNVVLEKYGDPSYGLSVSIGAERGEKMLDALNVVRIQSYQDAMDLKEFLINKTYIERDSKGRIVKKVPIDHHIQIVSFDVVDELFPLFEKETIRISNIENPSKKVKTINAAMNGRHNGQFYTADLVKAYMSELIDAGFGVWAIAHSKMKTIKEKGSTDEEGYNQLTSSLMATYDGVFADIFDVVLTGVIDRDIEEKKTIGSDGKEVVKRYATGEVRKLYFRGTTLIDAGGRFDMDAVPEYMIFDKPDMAADFIKVIEEGMEKSKKDWQNKNKSVSTQSIKAEKVQHTEPNIVEPQVENETTDDDLLDVTENKYPENLSKEVSNLFKSTKDAELKSEVRATVKEYGTFGKVPQEVLEELYDKLV